MKDQTVGEQTTDGVSRRCAMRRVARAGLAMGVAWTSAERAGAQATLLAKDAVKYTDQGDVPGKGCDDCLQYVAPPRPGAPATCRVVAGAISPHGHCIAFTPRARP